MILIGKILLRDSQFRLQDMKEIYTTGNGLYNNIVHKILVKGKEGRPSACATGIRISGYPVPT